MLERSLRVPRAPRLARTLLGGALLVLGGWIASSFVAALVWGAIIAIAVDPLHMRLRARWPGSAERTVLAAILTALVALAVLIPITAGVTRAVGEAHELATWIATAQRNGVPLPAWVADLPVGREALTGWWAANLATPQGATEQLHHLGTTGWLSHTGLIGRDLLHRLVNFVFALLVLFFLLRDRDVILAQLRRAGERLIGPSSGRLGLQAIRSIRGTIDGLVLVGIGEGAVMWVVYLVLGVPHPVLLGALTAVAAMIPFGAALVFALAGVLLLLQGAVTASIAVIVIGLVVVGIADHLVRPALIGGATKLPFVWVLIGILGGVEAMGLLGLFVGPATMAVLVMLWRDLVADDGNQPASAGRET